MSLRSMLQGLRAHEIEFVVVGGVAGVAHGSVRVTEDLDICYDLGAENLARLASLLAAWEAYPREIEAGLPFIMDVRQLRTQPLMTLATREGDLDLLDRIAGVGEYAAVLAHSTEVAAFDVAFRTLSLPALIAAKRAANRPRDREHLKELEALLALHESAARPDAE